MIRLKKLLSKKIPVLLVFLCLTCGVFAQSRQGNSDFWSKVRYGGGIGLGFGNNAFNVAISPSAIYQASNQFATGVGLSFNYSKFGDDKLTAYGASVLNYYNPIPEIQLSAEFEQLRINREFDLGTSTLEDDYWLPALFLGVGYGNRNFVVGVRYDVLYDDDRSIYADPWAPFVRVYF